MNVKVLIDNIMRQTTVLIAQLSTSAGVRAPLAHIADQVFLQLAREIEAQGVARKVVADMFGLALRGYQKKTQRLAQSSTTQGKTLFEAVLEFIEREHGATRSAVLKRFHHDGERETIGVLTDLLQSGLIYATGNGDTSLYGITSDAERQKLTRESDGLTLASMALGEIYRNPGVSLSALEERLGVDGIALREAVETLVADGSATLDANTNTVSASTFQVPVDARFGWESAVFDHFQAVTTAIANKLALKANGDSAAELVGGATLRFELTQEHPHKQEVLDLLRQTRQVANALWEKVGTYNDDHPPMDAERFIVTFYLGQNIDDTAVINAGSGVQS